MHLRIASRRSPKSDGRDYECQDAIYPAWDGDAALDEPLLAIADGAADSWLSGNWAEVLVESFGRTGHLGIAATFADAADQWRMFLAAYLAKREEAGRPLRWFEEHHLERGAWATFLGLSLVPRHDCGHGTWIAISVGDSCLFHVRANELSAAFPIDGCDGFDRFPHLVPSTSAALDRVSETGLVTAGDWRVGDRFILATDALAQWFLCAHEQGDTPWETLDNVLPDAFSDWLSERRLTEEMRDDDVALIVAEVL
jgi:hypothetical protein